MHFLYFSPSVLQLQMYLYFLMNIAFYLNIHWIISLELPLVHSVLILVCQFDRHFLSVLSLTLPKYIFYDIVDWNVDRCAFQSQWYHETFCAHFLLFLVQVQVYKAFDHFLLQLFSPCSCGINLVNLIYQVLNLNFCRLLLVNTLFKLLVHHVISESSQRRGKMCVAFKIETVMPVESVQVSFVGSKFLNLNGPQ